MEVTWFYGFLHVGCHVFDFCRVSLRLYFLLFFCNIVGFHCCFLWGS